MLHKLKKLTAKAALSTALTLISCIAPQAQTEKATQEQKIILIRKTPEQFAEEDKKVFSYIKENGFNLEDAYEQDQQGRYPNIRELLAKSISGKKAKAYAEIIADTIYKEQGEDKYETLDSKIDLAKNTLILARKDMQRTDTGGQGNYTKGYEFSFLRYDIKKNIIESDDPEDVKRRELEALTYQDIEGADSVQTFDEFFGPKNDKIFAGDCDDFSMALITTYYALSEYAEANKDKNEFYKALAEGLKHYRIYSIIIKDHSMNMEVTTKDKLEFKVIEPQAIALEYDLESKEGSLFFKDRSGAYSKILYIYNLDFSATKQK